MYCIVFYQYINSIFSSISFIINIKMFSSIRRSVNVIKNNNINMQNSLVLLRCLASSSGRHNGVVKWYNPVKGFGFITYNDGTNDSDIFVHQSVIKAEGFRSLSDGEC